MIPYDPITTLAVVTGVLAGLWAAGAALLFKLWVKPTAWEAMVITGAHPGVLIDKGRALIPFLSETCRVSLKPTQAIHAARNLISKDRLQMNLRVAVDVAVPSDKDDDIRRAAMVFGNGDIETWDQRVIKEIDSVLAAAIRTAASTHRYDDILTQPQKFQDSVTAWISDDLCKLGLCVLSVSLLEVESLGVFNTFEEAS